MLLVSPKLILQLIFLEFPQFCVVWAVLYHEIRHFDVLTFLINWAAFKIIDFKGDKNIKHLHFPASSTCWMFLFYSKVSPLDLFYFELPPWIWFLLTLVNARAATIIFHYWFISRLFNGFIKCQNSIRGKLKQTKWKNLFWFNKLLLKSKIQGLMQDEHICMWLIIWQGSALWET